MQPPKIRKRHIIAACAAMLIAIAAPAQVIISQYYEGTGTNKWIELTNLGNTAVNTASPQLKLGLWVVSGSTGNISFSGAPGQTMNLTVTIPAKGTVLIGNTGNGTEIPYLTAASAVQTSNTVINFNGNDGIALLNASNNIIDQFGNGINATDISYVRSGSVTTASATYVPAQWTTATIAAVQTAGTTSSTRLGVHAPPPCVAPAAAPTGLSFGAITSSSIAGSFTAAAGADGYLVVRSTAATLSANPVNGTTYLAGAALGGGTVVSSGTATSFTATGLTASTTYYFYIFSMKSSGCSGGPAYFTATKLTGNIATIPGGGGGSLNFYFGNLHAHSSYSDGNADDITKVPSDDYTFAKNALCMDYLGISEHNHTGAGMNIASWPLGRTQAAAATSASFVGMYGMEWGVISGGGHVIVYGIDSLIGWEAGQYQLFVPKSTYTGTTGLFYMLNRHGGNALATLAHPNNTDYNNVLGVGYEVNADNAIVGSAVESGPAFSVSTTYNDPPTAMSYLTYYRSMLAKGYHLGPTIDHDNHNMTFGRTIKSRTVILAPSLSESSLLGAMRQMRFYASQDCAAKITFTINTQPMGSILRQAGAPVLSVSSVTSSAVTSLKVMYGVPGSGTAATQLTAVASGSLSYTHTALANLATGYYYLDITEADGSRIITSPIWYTRDDAALLRGSITSFFTVNEPEQVILKWTTEREEDGVLFGVQRSIDDGKNWQPIGNTVYGHNTGSIPVNYALPDIQPFEGRALYRLVQTSVNGGVAYSEWKIVDRSNIQTSYVIAFPNPVQHILYLKTGAVKNERTHIEFYDMSGVRVLAKPASVTAGEQYLEVDLSPLHAGTYMMKMVLGGKVITKLVSKQ